MSTERAPRRSVHLVAALTAALALVLSAAPAGAVSSDQVGVFPTWQVAGASGSFTATPVFPASAGFPATPVTSTSTVLTPQSGASAYLNAGTGFGQEFGSSRLQPYLTFGAAAGRANSTTTITFDAAPPSGWGFALGDVDAEWIFIQAYANAARTIPLPPSDLGFRGAENYCAPSPRPSGCSAAPFTDAPVWVTAPETFDGIDYVPGTLRGNSLPGSPGPTRDTAGAYGWFTPSSAVRAMTLTFGVRDGSPTSQLWMASPAPRLDVRGTVVPPAGMGSRPLSVVISEADGSPVEDYAAAPLMVPVDPATGAFEVELPQSAEGYIAQVVVPDGFVAPEPVRVPGVPSGADGAVVLDPITVAAAPTEPDPEPTTPPSAAPVGDTPDPSASPVPRLAASGGSAPALLGMVALAAAVLAVGTLLLRRRA